ncbi:MAG: PAS domain S-box protein, partial [Marinobacter sp.]
VAEDASPCFGQMHPDDVAAVSDSIAVSARNLGVWQEQYRVRNEGSWRWIEGRATPELLADDSIMWHGYIADIDDKKKIQLALQESEDQLRHLFELSPIGIALNDYHSTAFLDVNQALLTPTGYKREDLMALNLSDLLAGGVETVRDQAMTELETTGRFGPFEQDIVRRDGSMYPAVIQGMRITSASGRDLVWSLIEDISERKKVERMKNEFISTVSHELRTPLTSIAGSLGLVAGGALGPLPEQAERMVSIAARNSDQLKRLIDDLLDMEKLVSGRMLIRIQSEIISPVIHDCIERLHTYALDRGVSILFRDHHPQQRILVDRNRLDQALSNLLSNAIK